MSLLHKLKQTVGGQKGIEFLAAFADQLESVGHDGVADKIRGYNYSRQMERLEKHRGYLVHLEYCYPEIMNEPWLYVQRGKLAQVFPFAGVTIQDESTDVQFGIPFMGLYGVKGITTTDGELLYFNPYIGPDWIEKWYHMSEEEATQFRRKLFGKAGLLKLK